MSADAAKMAMSTEMAIVPVGDDPADMDVFAQHGHHHSHRSHWPPPRLGATKTHASPQQNAIQDLLKE